MMVVVGLATAAWTQQPQISSVEVNGRTGDASVIRRGGSTYIDAGALAQIANGALSFRGDRIVLTLPAPAAAAAPPPAATATQTAADPNSLSRDFMKAAIEDLALMREWGSPLAYAIQNGYPVTDSWVNGYRDQAAQGLRLAEVAASTDGDRSALQLLNAEFQAVQQWSNKLVKARTDMNAANYTMSPDALRNDPNSQKIITCGRFLASMLGSGTFQDGPCH